MYIFKDLTSDDELELERNLSNNKVTAEIKSHSKIKLIIDFSKKNVNYNDNDDDDDDDDNDDDDEILIGTIEFTLTDKSITGTFTEDYSHNELNACFIKTSKILRRRYIMKDNNSSKGGGTRKKTSKKSRKTKRSRK